MKKLTFLSVACAVVIATSSFVLATDNPLLGKTIALDAGHGGGETGAIGYCGTEAAVEADVNIAVRSALVAALGLPNKGIKNDGYGMTVYGRLPGVLTEAYFITDTDEACDFLGSKTRIETEAE